MVWLINPNHPEGLCISCLSCSSARQTIAISSPVQASPSMPQQSLRSFSLVRPSESMIRFSIARPTCAVNAVAARLSASPLLLFASRRLSLLCLCESTQFHSISAHTHASASPRYALALLSKSKPSLRLTPLFISLAYRTISLPQPLTSFLPVALAAPVTSMQLRSFSILSHCFSVLFCAVP